MPTSPVPPCGSSADAVYWARWFAASPDGYDRAAPEIRRSQARTAPGGGDPWTRIDLPLGCGPERARHLGSVALGCAGKGPLMRGITPGREDEARRIASAHFDAFRGGDRNGGSAEALYRKTKDGLAPLMTLHAAHARALADDRRMSSVRADQSIASDESSPVPMPPTRSSPRGRGTRDGGVPDRLRDAVAAEGYHVVDATRAPDGLVHLALVPVHDR